MHLGPWLLAIVLLASAPGAAGAEDFSCPDGTEKRGAAPPEGGKLWCQLPDGTQEGPSLSFYDDGTRRAEAHFEAGELDGSYREWHRNGQVALEVRYNGGKKDGVERQFYPDGAKLSERRFEMGVPSGTYHEWHADGTEALRSEYRDGALDGPASTWYANGQKRSEGRFVKGQMDGRWVGWYEDGSVEKEAEFEEGRELSRKAYAPGEKR